MNCMYVMLEVSHSEMSLLKPDAWLNLWGWRLGGQRFAQAQARTHMEIIVVTLEVSHSEMSPLNLLADRNL